MNVIHKTIVDLVLMVRHTHMVYIEKDCYYNLHIENMFNMNCILY